MAAPGMDLAPSPSTVEYPDDRDMLQLVYIAELVYIAVLIIVSVLVMFLLHVLGSLRRRSSDKVLHAIVLGAYTLSYSLVAYTLGLMQDSQYYFDVFPVWAMCLLMLLGGTDNLTACNLNDVDNWKSFHVKHIFKGALVVYIVAQYGKKVPEYQKPLWAILCVNFLQSYVRIKSMMMASKSYLLSKNVKPIAEYMEREEELQLASGKKLNPVTMEGYRYIVAGEHRKQLADVIAGRKEMEEVKITPVEQIWLCKGSLLRSERGLKLKDVCLSMALSKMLNRRFASFDLVEKNLDKTKNFVFHGLLAWDRTYERAFRVIEVELGFVHDLYYTRYPYLYHKGRNLALCLPLVMVMLCSWLTYELSKNQMEHLTQHKEIRENIPLSTTLFLMVVVTFLEVFQLYMHLASDWFKVALIRSYVTRDVLQRSSGCFPLAIIGLLLMLKGLRPWNQKLGQYSLLENYNGTRRTSNCVHYVTLGLVDKARKGRKRGKLVKLSTQVKQAVFDSLVESNGQLTNGVRSLQSNGVHEQLSWACNAGENKVTRILLVWHIATTICKHQLDIAAPANPELSKEDNAAISTHSAVASALSGYCAHLVAFAPGLLPDHSFDSESILDKSIEEARSLDQLQGAKTTEIKCEKLMNMPDDANDEARVVVLGARLARKLINEIQGPVLRWKVLSDFWAEMVLYIAPCDDGKARAHLEAMARGGEFITHLWALLTHAGVLERGVTSGPLAAV